jgi:hypothetical protein
METQNEVVMCSVNRCPSRAITSESGRVGEWIVVIPYCEEHDNERRNGTPLGGVGLDAGRLQVGAIDEAMPQPGGRLPGID